MSTEISNTNMRAYWLRFGQIAVEMGFIDAMQLRYALHMQCVESKSSPDPSVLATILFDKEWMSSEQIDQVLNTVLKISRIDSTDWNNIRPIQNDDQTESVPECHMGLTIADQAAVCALVDVALHQKNGPVALAGISERLRLSDAYLECIFLKLRSHWLVAKIRGVNGGYSLARSADRITVADIVLAIEKPPFPMLSRKKKNCSNTDVDDWVASVVDDLSNSLNRKAIDYLASVSLKDLIDGGRRCRCHRQV